MDGQNFQNGQGSNDSSSQENNYYQNNLYTQPQETYVEPVAEKKGNTLATVSLVLGILGIVLACCCGIGFILSIIGLVCAIKANKNEKTGIGTAGLVCSIIGLIFGIGGVIYWAYCFYIALCQPELAEMYMNYYY